MSSIYCDSNFQNTRHGLIITTKQLEPLSDKNGRQQGRWHRFFQHFRPESISENLKVDKTTNRHISKHKNRPLAKFFKDYNGEKNRIHFRLSPHMSSNLHVRKSSRNEQDSTNKYSSKALFLKDDNIFVKGENIFELYQLSMEELKAQFYKDKIKEERVTELRNYYRNNYFTEQEKIEQRRERFNSETANNDDLSQKIIEFEEEISNARKIFRKISHSLQKPKNTFKKLLKELEQEQLIINYSLAEECKNHNIDP
jgi:hypothetical protein